MKKMVDKMKTLGTKKRLSFVGSITLTMLLASGAIAKIPEPDNIIYGAAREDATKIRLQVNGEELCSYTMGSNPDAGNFYVLRVPMDKFEPYADGTAQTGDTADIYVNDETTPVYSTFLSDAGSVSKVHLATNDSDEDGLTDVEESDLGTNPNKADSDGDGLHDADEITAGTNPLLSDTDGDGVPDGVDIDPLNPLLGELLGGEADLAGTYFAATLDYDTFYDTEGSGIWNVSFDGSGRYTQSGEHSSRNEGSASSSVKTGPYVVDYGGLGLMFKDGSSDVFDISVKENKDVIVSSQVRDDSFQLSAVAVLSAGFGYSNSNLNGEYYFATITLGSDGTAGSEWSYGDIGSMIFDGAGNYSGSKIYSKSSIGSSMSASINGTYGVNADGTFTLSTLAPSMFNGGIKDDNTVFVAANVSDQNEQGMWFGVKAGVGGYSNKSLKGTYYMMDYTVNPGGYYSSMKKLIFDGFGGFFMEQTYNHSGTGANQTQSASGTYTVSNDGKFIFDMGGEISDAALSDDAKSFISSRINDVDVQGVSFGVKLIPLECDPDTDSDVDGKDLASFAHKLSAGTNEISVMEFAANFAE